MRAVVDPNVLIAAALSRDGSPAKVLTAWLDGHYDLVVSPALLAELTRALAYPRIRARVSEPDAIEFVALVAADAVPADDPADEPAIRSADPDDDYLIALAASSGAVIVSGDHHLTDLRGRIPVYTPTEFLTVLGLA